MRPHPTSPHFVAQVTGTSAKRFMVTSFMQACVPAWLLVRRRRSSGAPPGLRVNLHHRQSTSLQ
ncbi:hypothetical protein R6G99_10425, partial [Actinotignum timonense]|nr:hypothetical protein [Actinotignum timonense]